MKLFLYAMVFLGLSVHADDMGSKMTDDEAVEAAMPSLEEDQDTEKDTAFDALDDTASDNVRDSIMQ